MRGLLLTQYKQEYTFVGLIEIYLMYLKNLLLNGIMTLSIIYLYQTHMQITNGILLTLHHVATMEAVSSEKYVVNHLSIVQFYYKKILFVSLMLICKWIMLSMCQKKYLRERNEINNFIIMCNQFK